MVEFCQVVDQMEVISVGLLGTIEFRKVKEHIEVYQDGKFIVSADNLREAEKELEEMGVKW